MEENGLTQTKLSLFQIEAELRGLAEQRCDALDRLEQLQAQREQPFDGLPAEIAETKAEIDTCDKLIRAYVSKEVQKVDSCGNLILDLTARASIHRQEADRLYMLAKSEEATRDRVKELLLAVMEEFGEKRLYGRNHDLVAVGNGGVPPLLIAQPELVPDSFREVTVCMPLDQWITVMQADKQGLLTGVVEKSIEPFKPKIRAALTAKEGVPGCRLDPRGKNLQVK